MTDRRRTHSGGQIWLLKATRTHTHTYGHNLSIVYDNPYPALTLFIITKQSTRPVVFWFSDCGDITGKKWISQRQNDGLLNTLREHTYIHELHTDTETHRPVKCRLKASSRLTKRSGSCSVASDGSPSSMTSMRKCTKFPFSWSLRGHRDQGYFRQSLRPNSRITPTAVQSFTAPATGHPPYRIP